MTDTQPVKNNEIQETAEAIVEGKTVEVVKDGPTTGSENTSHPGAIQSLQNQTVIFEPTNTMLKWFDTAVDLGYTASISQVSEVSGVARSMWYDWMKKDGFAGWWDSQWQQYFNSNRWKLKAIGMKQAERNYDYWHDMMTASGQLAEAKGTNVQVNTFIAGKKDEYKL